MKTKWFQRFVRRQGIDDASLREVVDRIGRGLVDADLGGHLVKQRIARPGKGRSGGFRVIVVYRDAHRAVFVYGFAKSEKDNLSSDELEAYKNAAVDYLALTEEQLSGLVAAGALLEIGPDGQTS